MALSFATPSTPWPSSAPDSPQPSQLLPLVAPGAAQAQPFGAAQAEPGLGLSRCPPATHSPIPPGLSPIPPLSSLNPGAACFSPLSCQVNLWAECWVCLHGAAVLALDLVPAWHPRAATTSCPRDAVLCPLLSLCPCHGTAFPLTCCSSCPSGSSCRPFPKVTIVSSPGVTPILLQPIPVPLLSVAQPPPCCCPLLPPALLLQVLFLPLPLSVSCWHSTVRVPALLCSPSTPVPQKCPLLPLPGLGLLLPPTPSSHVPSKPSCTSSFSFFLPFYLPTHLFCDPRRQAWCFSARPPRASLSPHTSLL